jgi:hypothetical protein
MERVDGRGETEVWINNINDYDMKIDKNNDKHIIADDGKMFERIADGTNYGKEIYLGYSYFIGGEKLDVPHLDTPEDFREVDEPKEDEQKENRDE